MLVPLRSCLNHPDSIQVLKPGNSKYEKVAFYNNRPLHKENLEEMALFSYDVTPETNRMRIIMAEKKIPWMCHVCERFFTVGEGIVCGECFMLTCSEHITTATVLNQDSGLYELKKICAECQFKKSLHQ